MRQMREAPLLKTAKNINKRIYPRVLFSTHFGIRFDRPHPVERLGERTVVESLGCTKYVPCVGETFVLDNRGFCSADEMTLSTQARFPLDQGRGNIT